MTEQKFYVPHRYQSRGAGVAIDPKTPNSAQVHFDVNGSARYLFSMSRRELERLARAIQRKLEEVPPPSRRRSRSVKEQLSARLLFLSNTGEKSMRYCASIEALPIFLSLRFR